MILKGKIWKLGDDISTDLICPGRFYHLRSNIEELAKHTFEDILPDFSKNVQKGDIVVAGKNFGLGSSREHAVLVIKTLNVSCIIAKSFARIFFRNCINNGLPAIECDTDEIYQDDILEINLSTGILKNLTKGSTQTFIPFPSFAQNIISSGGILEFIREKGDLVF